MSLSRVAWRSTHARRQCPNGHLGYIRSGQRLCTYCQWQEPAKRATYRFRDIRKGWQAGTRHAMEMSLDEFVRWYCAEAAVSDACHYCGLTREELRDVASPLCSWHIDRRDNSRPYTFGNLAPSCGDCNSWKGARRTYEQARANFAPLREVRSQPSSGS